MQRLITVPEGMPSILVWERLMAEELLTGEVPVPAEGSILPDTYAFERGQTRKRMVEQMQAAMDKALAEEWDIQGDRIDPAQLILRDMADFALDLVAADKQGTIAKLAEYGETDTLCYRADPEDALFKLQQESGDAVVYASLILAAIPTFLIFAFCQKLILRGIVVPMDK